MEFSSTGEHVHIAKETTIWFFFYILEHSLPVYSTDTSCTGYSTVVHEQTLNSAPIAFCCAFLLCLPSPLDCDILESNDYVTLLFAYSAKETLLEIWLASLKIL